MITENQTLIRKSNERDRRFLIRKLKRQIFTERHPRLLLWYDMVWYHTITYSYHTIHRKTLTYNTETQQISLQYGMVAARKTTFAD